MGARVTPEQRCDEKGNKRTDLNVRFRRKLWTLDFVVVHPLAPSRLDVASKSPLSSAAKAENDKIRKHEQSADHIGATFVPFAVESTCGIGARAAAFITEILKVARDVRNVWVPKDVVKQIWRTITCEIVRGNADILRSAKQKNLRAF